MRCVGAVAGARAPQGPSFAALNLSASFRGRYWFESKRSHQFKGFLVDSVLPILKAWSAWCAIGAHQAEFSSDLFVKDETHVH